MATSDLVPIGFWNFTERMSYARNSPNWQPTQLVGATFESGGLRVKDGTYAKVTGYTQPQPVTEKTLVAWVKLQNLDVRGGSALTLDSTTVDAFDGLVYAEKVPKQWMAGSTGFSRTGPVDAMFGNETATDQIVQICAIYRKDPQGCKVSLYRNGIMIGQSVYKAPLWTFQPSEMQVFFGKRHHVDGGTRHMDALIIAAAIYDVALQQDSIPGLRLIP